MVSIIILFLASYDVSHSSIHIHYNIPGHVLSGTSSRQFRQYTPLWAIHCRTTSPESWLFQRISWCQPCGECNFLVHRSILCGIADTSSTCMPFASVHIERLLLAACWFRPNHRNNTNSKWECLCCPAPLPWGGLWDWSRGMQNFLGLILVFVSSSAVNLMLRADHCFAVVSVAIHLVLRACGMKYSFPTSACLRPRLLTLNASTRWTPPSTGLLPATSQAGLLVLSSCGWPACF